MHYGNTEGHCAQSKITSALRQDANCNEYLAPFAILQDGGHVSMSWDDKGLIFKVNNMAPWAKSHCYVPTALALEDRIRVYAAFWDHDMHGRLGYVDVDIKNPTKILGYAENPIIADSREGRFDCDGVTPLSVVVYGEEIRLYYAGWQRFAQADKRYTLFTGLLLSDLKGENFKRWSPQPVIGPRHEGEHLRTGGYTSYINNRWQTWYACHEKTIMLDGKGIPAYAQKTMESLDGFSWDQEDHIVFPVEDNKLLGYGRPAIWFHDTFKYRGLFSERNWDGSYTKIKYGTSSDGYEWAFQPDSAMNFSGSNTCDSQNSVCFPSLIFQEDRTLMFYNGDDFGREGLRLAIWNENSPA